MTSRDQWPLLQETDDLLAEHALLLHPVRSLADAERQLTASGLRGPGFDDLLADVRAAQPDRDPASRAVERAREATENCDPQVPQQRARSTVSDVDEHMH